MQSSVFSGQVSHVRHVPERHAFRYRVFMLYLDLAELDTVFRGRWFWSASRPALARFRREDHFGDPDVPLDECVRQLVLERTGRRPNGPVRLLTNLAMFGYCFNPISVYYCFGEDGETIEAVVAEVSNTPWGERCCYVLPAAGADADVLRFRNAKAMHVSPFMDMDLTYDWLLTRPGDRLVIRIAAGRAEDRLFNAVLALDREPITGRVLAGVLAKHPLMTFKVMGAIYWQALRLWCKGSRVVPHPGTNLQART